MAQTTEQRYRVAPVRPRGRQWPFPLNLYQSAVGRKWVMAMTGIDHDHFTVALDGGSLHVYKVQPKGSGKLTAAEYIAAGRINSGEQLGV